MVMFLKGDSGSRINSNRIATTGAVSAIVSGVSFCRDRMRIDFQQILVGVVDDVVDAVAVVGVVDEAAVVLKNVQFDWGDW
jgi:hypothetical protein